MNGFMKLKSSSTHSIIAILLLLTASGCAGRNNEPVTMNTPVENDPLEPFNRCVYKFNYALDGILIKPLAKLYKAVTPKPVQKGISNFFDNLSEPVSVANSVLQGNGQQAFTHTWRFILNSTIGVGGLFDFAGENAGLYARNEDFGQTLGRYGVGSGPYLVLPILGPSNLRDAFGKIPDWFAHPVNSIDNDYLMYGLKAGEAVDKRAKVLDLTDEVYRSSLDPYATFRSGYTQYRESEVKNRN